MGYLTLWQAANLWVDQEPKAEIPAGDKAYPVLRRLKESVDELTVVVGAGEAVPDRVDMNIVATRESPRRYAEKDGDRPRFLVSSRGAQGCS